MVGFVERFRKPKSPIAIGSPEKDEAIPLQAPATPQYNTPPVLRNFSYPIYIGLRGNSPSSSHHRGHQTTWDQLGDLCNFSPENVSRVGQARTAGLDDPFFYKSERAPYSRLYDQDDNIDAPHARISVDQAPPAQSDVKSRKKQRRKCREEWTLKRKSLGHHKPASSLDAFRLIVPPSNTSPERPVSSSGVPHIDNRFERLTSDTKIHPLPLTFQSDNIRDSSIYHESDKYRHESTLGLQDLQMERVHERANSHGHNGLARDIYDNGKIQSRADSSSESVTRKEKVRKGRWFTQLKEWVSVSEPSTQAFNTYKKDAYKRAGVALNDPRANAKLHLPVGTLPGHAIKPAGRGPDPEEIALKKAEQRVKMRESFTAAGIPSQSSRSSGSRYSSSNSSVAFSGHREDM
ncbi:hypothetical protein F5Y15DRAFT_410800 [Xylariaceae sp. FL0016]|nr:hypothetical protein F5Y15DRAFT_410800 [Xylariaceae sp. FL0016]